MNELMKRVDGYTRMGITGKSLDIIITGYVKDRGPIGKGKYACSCDNYGPRWTRDNQCCAGCFQWAFDHHQEMDVNGVHPPTPEMIKRNTWGIRSSVIAKLALLTKHNAMHRERVAYENFKQRDTFEWDFIVDTKV